VKAATRGAELGGAGRPDAAGFSGGVVEDGRCGVGERTNRRGPCISGGGGEGGEKAPRMEGANQRRKCIMRNTPKLCTGEVGR
jgi:hypothetical protein